MTTGTLGLDPAVLEQLQAGLDAHRRGDLTAAEKLYRAVLAAAPETLDASNLLARLLVQVGRAGEAAPLLRHAIDRAPSEAGLWLSYTECLLAAGQLVLAREAAETARRLAPNDPDILYLWAEAQRVAGAWEMAAGGYRQLLARRSDHAGAWLQLGDCLRRLGDAPGALDAARRAVQLAPQAPECHNNLGGLLAAQGDHATALMHFDQALQLRPNYPMAMVNKAGSLRETGQAEAALALARQAVQLTQGHPDAWLAQAQALHVLGDLPAAVAAYREALSRRPQDAEGQWNYALAALAQGDFASGWLAYRWRWRKDEPPLPQRSWPWPEWQSDALPERLLPGRLLLWGEQGLGDRLLFLQYLPDLLARGNGSVTLETDARLIPLLRRSFPQLDFVAEMPQPDPALMAARFDAHLPLGDLPRQAPPGHSFLKADMSRAAELAARYRDGSADRLIGLSWRSANPALGAAKSLSPETLAPLAALKKHRFVCLQYGATEAEHEVLTALFGARYIRDPAIDAQNDLDGLAAQIAGLDLVLSVSNVTAHLAGALGLPVWLLAPTGKSRFFYLMGAGEDTPWYPQMRIFRHNAAEDWSGLLEIVANRLESLEKPGSR
ncbi:tetratricopeptide repeat protein [Ferrovibrio sp.]|uniref:tetratricopeptide repeat protein n=1 Tax=Ferrovibrio sp. TaxID=1917215 RepID=UPI00262D7440|nr:tetratricopeptide repeat protein [Ferrovibrio sp.]